VTLREPHLRRCTRPWFPNKKLEARGYQSRRRPLGLSILLLDAALQRMVNLAEFDPNEWETATKRIGPNCANLAPNAQRFFEGLGAHWQNHELLQQGSQQNLSLSTSSTVSWHAKRLPAWLPPLMTLKEGTGITSQDGDDLLMVNGY